MCATYGICGHRHDGDVLNCADNTRAQPLGSDDAARKLQDVCPQLVAETNGTYCCTEEQIDTLARQVSLRGFAVDLRSFYSCLLHACIASETFKSNFWSVKESDTS